MKTDHWKAWLNRRPVEQARIHDANANRCEDVAFDCEEEAYRSVSWEQRRSLLSIANHYRREAEEQRERARNCLLAANVLEPERMHHD